MMYILFSPSFLKNDISNGSYIYALSESMIGDVGAIHELFSIITRVSINSGVGNFITVYRKRNILFFQEATSKTGATHIYISIHGTYSYFENWQVIEVICAQWWYDQ